MLRRAALALGLLLAAIMIQLIILDNLRLPDGTGPDLVLLVVAAVGVCNGPGLGVLGGFGAGLALDVAPPATHLIGQYALVFCLVGYASGVLGADPDRSAWRPLAVVAVGSAVGEVLFTLTGMIFGDSDVTWAAARHVLPAAIIYDLLLSPFVLYAVVRASGLATAGLAALGDQVSPSLAASPLVAASGAATAAGTVLRDSGTGRVPRLTARSLRGGTVPGGAAGAARAPQRPPGRPVQLRLSGAAGMPGGSASATRIPPARPAARAVALRLGSRDWARRYRTGLPARRAVALRLGSRDWARRYRGSRPLGDGGGGRALRPARGPRLRGGVLPGGSAAATAIPRYLPPRPAQLRLGSARRRDGAIGGSVLGRRPRAGAFSSRGALGGTPRSRKSAGKTRVPRFRRSKPGTINGRSARPGLGGSGRAVPGGRRGRVRFAGRRLGRKRTGGLR
jgi:rod shape-determining protein MreD